jgi:hypothetical protein
MTAYDYNRPFIAQEEMPVRRYGNETVRVTELSNVEYKARFGRFAKENKMKEPPSCGRIFPGYLVVRHMGKSSQYETWMPREAEGSFSDLPQSDSL